MFKLTNKQTKNKDKFSYFKIENGIFRVYLNYILNLGLFKPLFFSLKQVYRNF